MNTSGFDLMRSWWLAIRYAERRSIASTKAMVVCTSSWSIYLAAIAAVVLLAMRTEAATTSD